MYGPDLKPDASHQEIFDFVVKKLFEQGQRSIEPSRGCQYRTETGLKCAVGFLIPDNLYDEEMDRNSASACMLIDDYDLFEKTVLRPNNRDFLTILQSVHDNGWMKEDAEFVGALKTFAQINNLDTSILWATTLNGKMFYSEGKNILWRKA